MNLRAKLSIAGEPVGRGGGVSSWNDIENKPFSTVDTENGLTIQDDTLMIDTLDHIATIDYVDQQIDSIDLSDYYTKSQTDTAIDNAIDEIDMSGFATQTELQQVADSIPSDYVDTTTFNTLQSQVDQAEQDIADIQSDFATKQELADSIPVDVSELNNDAGYVTSSEAQQTIAALPDNSTIRWNSNNKLETVFTGSYNDLTNKPTIPTVPTDVSDFTNDAGYITSADLPEADGTTIIDNNGVWSAVGGGSVDIDNQSIVENQQGQIETAVKLYKEDITTTYNAIKGWTPSGKYLYAQNNPYAIYLRGALNNTGSDLYTIIVNFDFENNNYQLSGVCNQIGLMSSNNFLWGDIKEHFDGFGVSNSTGNSAQLYTHAYFGSAYTINWVVVKEADYNATYSDTDQEVIEAVYHKLPVVYIPVDNVIQEDSNGNLSLAHDFLYDMVNVGTSMGKSRLNVYKYPNYGGLSIDISSNPTVNKTSSSNGFRTAVGGAFGSANGNYFSQSGISFTRRSGAANILEANANVFNSYGENNYCWVRMYYNYAGLDNPSSTSNCPYAITGRMHLGSILTDPSDFTIEGLESILDSAVYDSSISKYVFTFKSDIYPAHQSAMDVYYLSQVQYRPLNDKYQKINSFFLPLDNNTIKRDSDGNITTAIPAPPTTDGNYTLAVTVTNGEPAYSWV